MRTTLPFTFLITVLTAILAVMPFSNSLIAQDNHTWTNTTGSTVPYFDVGGNWDLGIAPGETENALFNANAFYEVHWDNFTGDRTINDLTVSAGEVDFLTQDSTTYNLTATFGISVAGADTILFLSGVELQSEGELAIFDGATLQVIDGSTFDSGIIANTLVIGAIGEGTLDIISGGSASSNLAGFGVQAGSEGTVNVTGADSTWTNTGAFQVGGNGNGTLNIENGGVVTQQGGDLAVALFAGQGRVNIDGAGSELDVSGPLNVGFGGQGQVNVTGGATLRSVGGTIFDADAFSRVRVDGAGSQWINTGSLTNELLLKIDNGATVSLDGPITNNDNISIGGSGGTLIATSGIVNNDDLSVSGTTSEIQGNITNGDEIVVFGNATLTVTGDVTNTAAALNDGLISDGTTRFEGSYNGGAENGNPEGNPNALVVLTGQYRPGNNGPAITTFVNVSLEMQATNTTFIELGGTASGDFDRIELFPVDDTGYSGVVEPNLTLAGNLDVQLVGGFTLEAGQSFEIINFDSTATFSGTFANFAEGDVVLSDNGFDLVISYVGGDVVLTTVPAQDPKGELTGDSLVVTGTDDNDTIFVTRTGVAGQVSVIVSDCPEEIYDGVEQIIVNGKEGDDTIEVDFLGIRVIGGNGDDMITVLSEGGSEVFGGCGNDIITGGPGADILFGGFGMDTINGMGGADEIYGHDFISIDTNDTHQNILFGGDGNDLVVGTSRVDMIDGGRGSDDIFGLGGADIIDGFHGNDYIEGGTGNDEILGGLGSDEIFGGRGNDTILGQAGQDMLFGGTGTDNLNGGLNKDTIFGQGGDDVLSGSDGNDTLFGGTGNDELLGGTGNDILNGQNGSDLMFGQAGDDQFTGGLGQDTFNGGPGNDTAVDNGEAGEISVENS